MRAELYFIADSPSGRLAIMPRPRGGDWLEAEAVSWRQQGLDVVVSLLEDDEIAELGLAEEQRLCEEAGLQFIRFLVPDRGVPESEEGVSDLVIKLAGELRAGRGVGIHCRFGIGRSACLAVCVLNSLGMPLDVAWAAVERARGLEVPDTPAQRAWVAQWSARYTPLFAERMSTDMNQKRIIARLVDEELARIADPHLVAAIRPLLVEPYPVERD